MENQNPEGTNTNVKFEDLDSKTQKHVTDLREENKSKRLRITELENQLNGQSNAQTELDKIKKQLAEAETQKLEEANEYKSLYEQQKAEYENIVKTAETSNQVLESILESRLEGLSPELKTLITSQPLSIADKMKFADETMKQLNITNAANTNSPATGRATQTAADGADLLTRLSTETDPGKKGRILTDLKNNFPDLYATVK
jgi:hypothetical protein